MRFYCVLAILLLATRYSASAHQISDRPSANAAPGSQPAELPELVARIKRSVVTVRTFTSNNERVSQGSGFFFRPGVVVTCRHVLDGAQRAEVRLASGQTLPVDGVAAESAEYDLLGLHVDFNPSGTRDGSKNLTRDPAQPDQEARQIESESERVGPALRASATTLREADRVFVIGSPEGLELTVSEGIISAVRDLPGIGRMLQTTAAISPGSSGSPVLNMKGEVVGIATSQMIQGQLLNFALPVECLNRLDFVKPRKLADWAAQPRSTAKSEHRRGVEFALAQQYDRALEHLERAARLDPDGWTWFWIAVCRAHTGRPDLALDAYSEAIRLAPDVGIFHVGLADLLASLGRKQEQNKALERAVDHYEQLVRKAPDDYVAHYNLGFNRYRLARFESALRAYQQAIRIAPDFTPAQSGIGLVYAELGREEEAAEAFKRAIRIDPNDAIAHQNLGASYHRLGRYRDALAAYKEAVRLDPKSETAHHGLGLTYVLIHDSGAALDEYRILKELDKDRAAELFSAIYP